MKLGISEHNTLERNLAIILEHYKINHKLTILQVRFLRRFKWVQHKKSFDYPQCMCLGCVGIYTIKEEIKRENK